MSLYIFGKRLLVKSQLSCFQVRSWKDTHLCVSKMSDLFVEMSFFVFRRHCTSMALMSRSMQLNNHLECGLQATSQQKVQVEVYYLMALIANLFSLQLEVFRGYCQSNNQNSNDVKELKASSQEDQNQGEVLLKKKMMTSQQQYQ